MQLRKKKKSNLQKNATEEEKGAGLKQRASLYEIPESSMNLSRIKVLIKRDQNELLCSLVLITIPFTQAKENFPFRLWNKIETYGCLACALEIKVVSPLLGNTRICFASYLLRPMRRYLAEEDQILPLKCLLSWKFAEECDWERKEKLIKRCNRKKRGVGV